MVREDHTPSEAESLQTDGCSGFQSNSYMSYSCGNHSPWMRSFPKAFFLHPEITDNYEVENASGSKFSHHQEEIIRVRNVHTLEYEKYLLIMLYNITIGRGISSISTQINIFHLFINAKNIQGHQLCTRHWAGL